MRRKLYFVLPDIQSAQSVMDELLLARVSAQHIHFHASKEQHLGNLPRANVLEKSDVIYGAMGGMGFGAVFGFLGGVLAYMVPWWFGEVSWAVIPYCMGLGAAACAAWAATLASGVPSHRLQPYQKEIDRGNILMIVSVPLHRLMEIRGRVMHLHPEAMYSGVWPAEHVLFP
ncbi:MAG TPA: hypothetical protein VGE17_01490 [Methylophilus sp.]